MNGYNFTEQVRNVLAMAREEATRLHHEYVGTEHILLGLIREGEGVVATVLQNLGVELDDIQQTVEETVKRGEPGLSRGPDLPYTSRAKKVLELSMSEARELDHSYVGTEHLLLGLLRERKGMGAQVLTGAGVTLEAARDETIRILGDAFGDDSLNKPRGVIRHEGNAAASLPDPIPSIVAHAFRISKAGGRPAPDVADLLQAVVFSSREVAAAFAAREIDFQGMILEIRALLDQQ